jgi:hypothetical protein
MTGKVIKNKIEQIQNKTVKPIIDLILGKTMSRKLQVLILATWLVKIDKISGTEWMFIALLYVLGILWLNHVQSMAKLGKSWSGKEESSKFGSPEFKSEAFNEDYNHKH